MFNNFQVENLTRKAQLQEVELERTTKQLKEAITVAGEETAKCKAAKEVIKSLTAQVRWMILLMIKIYGVYSCYGNNNLRVMSLYFFCLMWFYYLDCFIC